MTRRGRRRDRAARPQAGYSLLFAVFMAATMLLLASVAAPNILNNGRREREQELIWRGNQYMRGIRLYFQKNGRFPQNKEELMKGTIGVHFVRKAYSDPVALKDADWRFIYVAPTGQLTGSVRFHTLQEMAIALGGGQNAGNLAALLGGPAAAAAAPGAGNATNAANAGAGTGAAGAAPNGQGGPGGPGATPGAPGNAAASANGTSGIPPIGQADSSLQPAGSGPTPVPLQAVDGPVLGAQLIGVASKVKKDSLLVYQGKENYFQWEFIYNPLLNKGPGGTTPGQLPSANAPVAGAAGAGNGAGATTGPGAGTPPAGAQGGFAGSMFGPGRGQGQGGATPPVGFGGAGPQ
jgi:hypothetical protein